MSLTEPTDRRLRLCSTEQSRMLDEETIQSFGIDGNTLMEIAGMKGAEIIASLTQMGQKGVFLCGKGNNAGDALVIARYLAETSNHRVHVILTAGDKDLSPDAALNLDRLKKLANSNSAIAIADLHSNFDGQLPEADYLVDGLIGTGLSSGLREPFLGIVNAINLSRTLTFSLDCPTGLNCNTGQILGESVRADHTITFGTNKIGFYLNDGPQTTGTVHFADLPFPNYLRKNHAVLVDESLNAEIRMPQTASNHKYDKGTVHIVAGSAGMTGAAIMCAESAWKAGAGAVFLYAPKALLATYEQTLPQIIKVPLGSDGDDHFKPIYTEQILTKIAEKPGPAVIGPGAGRKKDTVTCFHKLLKEITVPVLLDADGLLAFEESKMNRRSDWILTPHPGELKHALNIEFGDDHQRLEKTVQFAKENGVTLVSKGFPTVVAGNDSPAFITGYNTKKFARAGFGDVLAGTIAGNLAVSKMPIESILRSLIETYTQIKNHPDPDPRDIYDR